MLARHRLARTLTAIISAALLALAAVAVPPASSFVGSTGTSWERMYAQGSVQLEQKKYGEAERLLLESIKAAKGDINKTLATLESLIALYEETEDYKSQEQMLALEIRLCKLCTPVPVALLGVSQMRLGDAYSIDERYLEAQSIYKDAIANLKTGLGPAAMEVAITLNNLAWAEYELGLKTAAEAHFRQCLYIVAKELGVKNPFYALTSVNLAELYMTTGNKQSAFAWYQKAIPALTASFGADNAFTLDAKDRLLELKRSLFRHSGKAPRKQPITKRNAAPSPAQRKTPATNGERLPNAPKPNASWEGKEAPVPAPAHAHDSGIAQTTPAMTAIDTTG